MDLIDLRLGPVFWLLWLIQHLINVFMENDLCSCKIANTVACNMELGYSKRIELSVAKDAHECVT